MIFRITCKQAAAMMVAREDRDLSVTDRVTLRLHIWACAACPKFEMQMLTMRRALGQWRHQIDQGHDADTPV